MSKKIYSLLTILSLYSAPSFADSMQDFLMSCAYGTGAGALVGVATLAFTEDPSSSINNIARGASLGLYGGIGLGLYLGQRNPDITAQAGTGHFAFVPLWNMKSNKQLGLDGGLFRFDFLNF